MRGGLPPPDFTVTSPSGLRFLVYLRPGPRSVRWFLSRLGVAGVRPGLKAACLGLRRADGDLGGLLVLPVSGLTLGLVAHELAHAAFRACELRGVKVRHWRHATAVSGRGSPPDTSADASEEEYATCLESLTEQFWAYAVPDGAEVPGLPAHVL